MLVDAGADPTEGLGPALHAYHQKTDQTEVIELLLRRGADPVRSLDGKSTIRQLVAINAPRYSERVRAMFCEQA